MADYDYGNARLRAMKAKLLSRHDMEGLADLESLQGIISTLIKSAYQPAVEFALARASGIDTIFQALHYDLIHTVRKTRTFFKNNAGELVTWVLRSYDVHNLKTILRSLAKHASSAEILSALLPVGELGEDVLIEISRAATPREAADMLASMNLVFAHPLLKLRAELPGADTSEMELALDHWLYQEAARLRDEVEDGEVFTSALELEADLTNLVTALRFADRPAERKVLRQQFPNEGIRGMLIGPGKLSFRLLENISNQDTLESAVKLLSDTIYAAPLQAGFEVYKVSGRLSDVEKHLRRYRLQWMAHLVSTDPLGIGVFLGYLALKVNEVGNLRMIAQGIHNGLKPDAIRRALEFAP